MGFSSVICISLSKRAAVEEHLREGKGGMRIVGYGRGCGSGGADSARILRPACRRAGAAALVKCASPRLCLTAHWRRTRTPCARVASASTL
jgi:hypothetical protein